MKKHLLILTMAFGMLTMGCNKTEAGQQPTAPATPEETTDSDVQVPPTPQHPIVVSVAGDGFLNIREMPVATARIVGKLLTGGRGARYLGSTGRWIRVSYEGVEGYVNGSYAQIQGLEEMSLRVEGAESHVYYVVIGSYENLSEAEKSIEELPDALNDANIFRAQDKGKTVYRVCGGCYYRQADAQRQVDGITQYLDRQAWVWASDGVAPCVYQGIGMNGEPMPIGPR